MNNYGIEFFTSVKSKVCYLPVIRKKRYNVIILLLATIAKIIFPSVSHKVYQYIFMKTEYVNKVGKRPTFLKP